MELSGSCSCGAVKFRIGQRRLRAYQCHCSICRKATGSACSTTVIVPELLFAWRGGEEKIATYAKADGYKVSFCSNCGSPLPNRFRGYPLYSVPLGSLDGEPEVVMAVQLHLGSKAAWDSGGFEGEPCQAMPSLDEMLELLQLRAVTP